MLRRTLVRSYDSPADASTTWAYLSDPVATSAAATHQTVVRPMPPLSAGSEWDVLHLEDDCDFDSVHWRCTALEPGRSMTVVGLQSGAEQRTTTTLHGGPSEVRVEVRLRVRSTLRAPGTIAERLLMPVLLLTPFGRRLLDEAFEEGIEDDRRALEALAGRLA